LPAWAWALVHGQKLAEVVAREQRLIHSTKSCIDPTNCASFGREILGAEVATRRFAPETGWWISAKAKFRLKQQ